MMNKKLSLIILFLLCVSLISVLLAFMAFSQGGNKKEVSQLKTGYEQLTKQVNELKVTTGDLDTKVNSGNTPGTATSPTTAQPAAPNPNTTPAPTTKTITGSSINMRSSASTNGKLVRSLTKGEKVTLTGVTSTSAGYQWAQVKDSKGNIGWVVTTYLQ
ncbi:SH3 domain-containing protein [[Brevibacterium] frigoritolerans]|nr:SH3 domain-containing protein [Peribacillus frigoritolerans]